MEILDNRFYSTYQLSKILGVSQDTIRRRIKTGEISALNMNKFGRPWYRVRGEEVKRLMEERD